MKNNVKIIIVIIIVMSSCGKNEELKEKYRPVYKTVKEAGYDIYAKTRYIRRTIFKAEHLKTNKYKFFITTKVYDDPRYRSQLKDPDKQYLHDYPFGLYVDSSGNIYLNNFYWNDKKVVKSELLKFNRRGRLLKRKKYKMMASNITRGMNNQILLLDMYGLMIIDHNLRLITKEFLFSISESLGNVYFKQLDADSIYRISNGLVKISIKKNKISLRVIDDSYKGRLFKIGSVKSYKKEMDKLNKWSMYEASHYHNAKVTSIFDSHHIGSVGFNSVRLGVDYFGNEYSDNQSFSTNNAGEIMTTSPNDSMNPVNYILVKKHRKPIYWKIKLPNRYGKPNDINALGSRSFSITPSGIIYMMTVTLTHLYIDKYVPEPVAKKAGGADKAYY